MSTLRVNAIQNTSGVQQYLAQAFVNFNGTGTVAIRASGNVSSITDNGTGDYTVNFTNALADANYAPVVSMQAPASTNGYIYINNYANGGSVGVTSQTASSYRVWFNNADSAQVATAVFR